MSDSARARLVAALFVLPPCLFAGFLFLAPLLFPVTTPFPCRDANVLKDWWWGGLQLWKFPIAYRVLCPLVPLLVLLAPDKVYSEIDGRLAGLLVRLRNILRHPAALFAALAAGFWLFRSASISFGDSQFYTTDLVPGQAFSNRGLIISYDSIGTTLLYSLGFRVVSRVLAINALQWYQLAGILFLLGFIGWLYATRMRSRALTGLAAVVLLFSGNWSQATLGAPEHYGQVFLATAAFAILAMETLAGREPLWKTCLAYSIGAFFHLLIGWLFPALVYTIISRWRSESRDGRTLALCAMLLPALLTGSISYFFGFDLSFWSASNAAEGKLIPFIGPMDPYSGGPNFHYTTFDPRHLAHILQENLLMGWPGILAVLATLPVARPSALLADRNVRLLALLLGCSLLFNLLWNPDLEMWKDQDLFSLPGLAWCLLGAYILTGPPTAHLDPALRRRLLLAAILGGLAWRLPVMLFHGMLDANYTNPALLQANCPFG